MVNLLREADIRYFLFLSLLSLRNELRARQLSDAYPVEIILAKAIVV